MFLDWWKAHKFEVILDLCFITALLFGCLVIAVVMWFKGRRR